LPSPCPRPHGLEEAPAFIFGRPTPDAELLARLQGVTEALRLHGTDGADRLGGFDVSDGQTGAAHGEEQIRLAVTTSRPVRPVGIRHGSSTSSGVFPWARGPSLTRSRWSQWVKGTFSPVSDSWREN